MRVRLIKKFAESIDGIDLRTLQPGDTLDLRRSDARLLIAEGWAECEPSRRYVSGTSHVKTIAMDRPKRRGR